MRDAPVGVLHSNKLESHPSTLVIVYQCYRCVAGHPQEDPIVIAVLQDILKQDPIVIAVLQGILKQDPIVIAVLQGILKRDPIVIAVL